MSDQWLELQELFEDALSLDEQAREALLQRRCAGNEALRIEAAHLLSAHDAEAAANAAAHSSSDSRTFGVWQTIRLIGRGGMGEVWLARRADGQHEQQAALKILSPYLAAPEYLVRFRRERQLLARLEHPNIARLLDGGMSDSGEPYLVMELVEGARLDTYCKVNGLSVERRLLLFCKVCAAVHSAHQHFVVHRDLKPGNILITVQGEPKLLDALYQRISRFHLEDQTLYELGHPVRPSSRLYSSMAGTGRSNCANSSANSMTAADRILLEWRIADGWHYDDIAARPGVPREVLADRVHHLRTDLRRKVKAMGGLSSLPGLTSACPRYPVSILSGLRFSESPPRAARLVNRAGVREKPSSFWITISGWSGPLSRHRHCSFP